MGLERILVRNRRRDVCVIVTLIFGDLLILAFVAISTHGRYRRRRSGITG
jgi:hypothetical protein